MFNTFSFFHIKFNSVIVGNRLCVSVKANGDLR